MRSGRPPHRLVGPAAAQLIAGSDYAAQTLTGGEPPRWNGVTAQSNVKSSNSEQDISSGGGRI